VILGVQQVAVGAAGKERLTRLWVEIVGLAPTGTYRSATENVDKVIVSAGAGRQPCEIDPMQPVDPDATPRANVPPLNHIGLRVDDLAAAFAWLAARGARFALGGIRK